MGTTAEICLGLFLVILAGILNGSWNASFSPTHGFAVGRQHSRQDAESSNKNRGDTQEITDLSYHHAWILFQVYAAAINIPICIAWAGGIKQVQYLVEEASGVSLALIIIFSILWGIGSVGFGLACKIAGVGLGTNLCMGVIMVLGTFLPLCLEGTIGTPAGGVVIAGLIVCSVGLVGSIQSLQIRDADERGGGAASSGTQVRRRTFQNITVSLSFRKPSPSTNTAENKKYDVDATKETRGVLEGNSSSNGDAESGNANNPSSESSVVEYSTLQKVMVCIIAGIFATQLQFAFVFGDEIIELAEESSGFIDGRPTTPDSGTSAVIWLFAISLGAPVSIVYGFYSNPATIPHKVLLKAPMKRHLWILLTTAIPWVAHIHLYGLSNIFLPEDMAASVAWPSLMMTTVVTGMVWSIVLGEWENASSMAKRRLYQGLSCVLAGVIVIMSSVAI